MPNAMYRQHLGRGKLPTRRYNFAYNWLFQIHLLSPKYIDGIDHSFGKWLINNNVSAIRIYQQVHSEVLRSTPNLCCIFNLALKFNKNISRAVFGILSTYKLSNSSYTGLLYIMSYCISNMVSSVYILIILPNDVHMNPGPQF